MIVNFPLIFSSFKLNFSSYSQKSNSNYFELKSNQMFINDGHFLERCASLSKPIESTVIFNDEERSIQELRSAEHMKNILFCSISHELRNPINHISGILECVKNYIDENDRINQFINIAISSTMMLKYKIDDIMDYSLLETNNLKIYKEGFNIRNTLNEIQSIL